MTFLLYGANGYTGELVAREAVRRGHRPILAGRRRERIEELARELELEFRLAALDDGEALAAAVAGVPAVLHCAGPFVRTVSPMVKACLKAGAHYLDITGEIPVFESIFRRHEQAREAGVVLLPGVGFDVVPTDCLAARLAEEVPEATHLELAFSSEGGSWSRGTLKTMIEGLPGGGAERRDGRIVPLPMAAETKTLPFPSGRRTAVPIPWGDLSTAFRTTGIPNIRVWSSLPPTMIRRMRWLRPLVPILALGPLKRALQAWVERSVTGPDEAMRQSATMALWGRAEASDGRAAEAVLTTPEGYTFTARAAVTCVERLLAEKPEPGSHTPAGLFGWRLVESIEGVEPIEVRGSG